MQSDDLDATSVRRALVVDRRKNKREGAEGIYRTAGQLRDVLPTDGHRDVALMLEWAIEGIRRQIEVNRTPQLEALHEAYAYARDVLVAMLRKNTGS
jgi:hypothetical protein